MDWPPSSYYMKTSQEPIKKRSKKQNETQMMFPQVSSTVTASRPHGHFKHEPTRGEGIRYSLIYGVPTCGSCLPGFDVEKD